MMDEDEGIVSSNFFNHEEHGNNWSTDSFQNEKPIHKVVFQFLYHLYAKTCFCFTNETRENEEGGQKEEPFLWYGWFIRKTTPMILLVWLLAFYYGATDGPSLLQSLNPNIDPPKNSPSATAIEKFKNSFPHFVPESSPFSTVIVVSGVAHNESVLSHAVLNFSLNLAKTVRCKHHCPHGKSWLGFVRSYDGFYLENDMEVRLARKRLFVSNDDKVMQIIMHHNIRGPDEEGLKLFYEYLQEFIDSQTNLSKYEVKFTSEALLLDIAKNQAIYDFEHADMIGIPFAWVILYLYCGIPAILVLITLPTSILFSFAINYYLIPMELPQFAPSLVVSIGVALNIDYALFILVRYTDELRKRGKSSHGTNEALDNALNTAGRTVGVSGTIMLVSNGSLSLVQAQTISSLGIGLALTNIVTMTINLTLLPALLHMNGNFFMRNLEFSLYRLFVSQINCCRNSSKTSESYQIIRDEDETSFSLEPGVFITEEWLKSFVEATIQDDADKRSSIFCSCKKRKKPMTLHEMFDKLNAKLNTSAAYEEYQELPDFRDQLVLSDDFFSGAEERENIRNGHPWLENTQPFSTTAARGYENNFSKAWQTIGYLCRNFPRSIIILSLACGVPLCLQVLHIRTTDSQANLVPTTNEHVKLAHDIPLLDLNPGLLADYKAIISGKGNSTKLRKEDCFDDYGLLIRINKRFLKLNHTPTCEEARAYTMGTCIAKLPGKKVTMDIGNICPMTCNTCSSDLISSKPFFDFSRQVAKIVIDSMKLKEGLEGKDYIYLESPSYVLGKAVTWEDARQIIQMQDNKTAFARYYQRIFAKSWGINHTSHLMFLYPPFHPYGHMAHPWISDLRRRVKLIEESDYQIYVGGAATVLFDQVDQVFRTTPYVMVTVVIITVIGSSLLAFNSALLGPRLLLTIAFTLCLVFGFSVLLFQNLGLSPDAAGIYWLVPIIGLPIIVGCTLDYDSFLVARIFEFRESGMETTAAVIYGLQDTARVITIAGCIMTVAFGSMLFSSVPVIKQIGTILVTCSLLDTFLVRSFLVPSLMLIAVDLNWWPKYMPETFMFLDDKGALRMRNKFLDLYRDNLVNRRIEG